MVEIVVPKSQYRQYVGVEKIKKLLERCQRITPLESTRAAGSGGSPRYCAGTGSLGRSATAIASCRTRVAAAVSARDAGSFITTTDVLKIAAYPGRVSSRDLIDSVAAFDAGCSICHTTRTLPGRQDRQHCLNAFSRIIELGAFDSEFASSILQ